MMRLLFNLCTFDLLIFVELLLLFYGSLLLYCIVNVKIVIIISITITNLNLFAFLLTQLIYFPLISHLIIIFFNLILINFLFIIFFMILLNLSFSLFILLFLYLYNILLNTCHIKKCIIKVLIIN
jgi:hypothetical protein